MLRIKDILLDLTEEQIEYELKMSCMTSDYTKLHPESSNCGSVFFLENDNKVCFEIDWYKKCKCFANELLDFNIEIEVNAFDSDDCCEIEFEEVFICDELKVVILI